MLNCTTLTSACSHSQSGWAHLLLACFLISDLARALVYRWQTKFNGNVCVKPLSPAKAKVTSVPPKGLGFTKCLPIRRQPLQGSRHPRENLCLLSLILFQMQSEARPCSWGLCLCDGLPEKAPVSAALCLGSFNWRHMVHYLKKYALLVVC